MIRDDYQSIERLLKNSQPDKSTIDSIRPPKLVELTDKEHAKLIDSLEHVESFFKGGTLSSDSTRLLKKLRPVRR
jgi:hypothetical protein